MLQSNYHPKFSLKTLVLFPKLTVIINNFAHKVARNNFSMKHSFFSSIYCLLTLRMSFHLPWIAKYLYISQISLYLSVLSWLSNIQKHKIALDASSHCVKWLSANNLASWLDHVAATATRQSSELAIPSLFLWFKLLLYI